jgi:hypothetical protein
VAADLASPWSAAMPSWPRRERARRIAAGVHGMIGNHAPPARHGVPLARTSGMKILAASRLTVTIS